MFRFLIVFALLFFPEFVEAQQSAIPIDRLPAVTGSLNGQERVPIQTGPVNGGQTQRATISQITGLVIGTSTSTTATGTVAAPTAASVHWNPVSPAANVSFNLATAPYDNYCQTYYNESNQYTYAMVLLGNFAPFGDTSIGEFGPGNVKVCYSSSTGEWSQS